MMLRFVLLGIFCLTIKANGQKVSIFPTKTAYTTANRQLKLICNYSERLTRNQVEWKRNGGKVVTLLYENNRCTRQGSAQNAGKDPFIYNCKDVLTFTILNIDEKNHGDTWSCSIDNLNSEPTKIYVQVPVQYVNFTSPPGDYIRAEENIPITFICNTSIERPRSEISWALSFDYPQDPVVGTNLNKDLDSLESTSASLSVRPFRAYGKFEVYCIASNVDSSPPVVSHKKIVDVTYAPKVRLHHYREVLVAEGERVALNCTVTSNPISTCRWTRNNDEILVELKASEIVYETHNIRRNDEGYYICRCSNGIGSDSAGVMVRVYWRPQSLTLTPKSTTYRLTEGSHVPNITCSADCNPPCHMIWQKFDAYNASAKLPAQNVPTIEDPVLSLGHVTRDESGTFVCIGISYIPGFGAQSGIQYFKTPPIEIKVV